MIEPDREWLRHLAEARVVDGGWQPANPEAVRELAEQRIAATIDELQLQAQEYADALSAVTAERYQVHVLPHAPNGNRSGFLLLLGRCQISVVREEWELVVSLTSVHSFERRLGGVQRYRPYRDALGAVYWQRDNTLIMPSELIIKRMFEDLVRAVQMLG